MFCASFLYLILSFCVFLFVSRMPTDLKCLCLFLGLCVFVYACICKTSYSYNDDLPLTTSLASFEIKVSVARNDEAVTFVIRIRIIVVMVIIITNFIMNHGHHNHDLPAGHKHHHHHHHQSSSSIIIIMFYLTDPPASIIVSIGLSIEYFECFGFNIALNEDLNLKRVYGSIPSEQKSRPTKALN